MLFFDRISESEGIDVNHTGLDTSKECNIGHFYFFKDRNFLYQPLVCNGCHNASVHAISLTDIKIIPVKGKTCKVVSNLLYSESYCLLESSSLIDKFGTLKITKNWHRLNKIKYSNLIISDFSLFCQISMWIQTANSRMKPSTLPFDHEDIYTWHIRFNHCYSKSQKVNFTCSICYSICSHIE